MRYVKSNDGKRRVCCFCSPRLRGLLNNRTIGGRKKRQPPAEGGQNRTAGCRKTTKPHDRGAGKRQPPAGVAKIAQQSAEKRQNRTIGVRENDSPPQGGPKSHSWVQKNDKTARSVCGKNDSPPQGRAKIAQLGAEKRQNRMIEVRLKKRMELNGIEPMTSRVRF